MYIYTHCLDINKLFTELKQRRTAKQQKTWMTGILRTLSEVPRIRIDGHTC